MCLHRRSFLAARNPHIFPGPPHEIASERSLSSAYWKQYQSNAVDLFTGVVSAFSALATISLRNAFSSLGRRLGSPATLVMALPRTMRGAPTERASPSRVVRYATGM